MSLNQKQVSYKTVFVLDHSPYFSKSCGHTVDVDVFKVKRKSWSKSLWTCSVEAFLEYRRVVSDIFSGTERLLRLVVSDSVGRFVSPDWSEESNQIDTLLKNLAQIGPADEKSEQTNCCIISGISLAVEALIQSTKSQVETKRRGHLVQNGGRLVVITNLKQVEEIKMIEDHVADLIEGQNRLAKNLGDNFLPLSFVELCLINTFPHGADEIPLRNSNSIKINDVLLSEFYSCFSGQPLTTNLHYLVQKHFNLASTTVSGIPMKEEQSTASSSSNYDVELLHPKEIHDGLLHSLGEHSMDGALVAKRHCYDTLLLKWCLALSKSGLDPQYSVSKICRATPVEVNSRPSACLTGFVLSGRTVMLESPKRNGDSKCLSHLLASHGGFLYIHSLHIGRSNFEEISSISDGPGGRVTDYRITHFSETLKECTLQIASCSGSSSAPPDIIEKNLKNIERITRFSPLVLSDSAIFSLSARFDLLLKFVKKRSLSETEMFECKKVIFTLSTMESNGEPLSTSSQVARIKGLKKDEQYRVVWNELENYLRNYDHYSSSHHALLNCLLQCTGRPLEPYVKLVEDVTHFKADEKVSQLGKRTSRMSSDTSVPENSQSPLLPSETDKSAVAPNKRARLCFDFDDPTPATKNLLTVFTKKEKDRWSSWRDFHARANCTGPGNKVELYPELFKKYEDESKRLKEEPSQEKTIARK